MRKFTQEEVAKGVCKGWLKKSKKLMKEFQELKGRNTFTFLDILTNSSINDKECDEIFDGMVEIFLGNDSISDFDKWFFDGTDSFLNEVEEHQYREIIYSLVREGKFERFLTEFKGESKG